MSYVKFVDVFRKQIKKDIGQFIIMFNKTTYRYIVMKLFLYLFLSFLAYILLLNHEKRTEEVQISNKNQENKLHYRDSFSFNVATHVIKKLIDTVRIL